MHQQLVTTFANSFIAGENFTTIVNARSLAEEILNQKIASGTPAAKLVDESVEQGLILAARQLVGQSPDPLQTWEQCLDLYDRQPALNTRTSTSILQQAYSTPIPIAFLAGKLAGIDREVTVYEPTAGNGALLLLADPSKATVNELNSDRAAALRAQGFTVTQEDASSFTPKTEAVDGRIQKLGEKKRAIVSDLEADEWITSGQTLWGQKLYSERRANRKATN